MCLPSSGPFIDPPKIENRRKRKDIITKCIQWFAGVSWLTAIAIFFVFALAQPPQENVFTKHLNFVVNQSWNMRYIYFSTVLLSVNVGICLFGFIFNLMRHKRKTDRFNKSIIFLGVLSITGLAAIIMNFF